VGASVLLALALAAVLFVFRTHPKQHAPLPRESVQAVPARRYPELRAAIDQRPVGDSPNVPEPLALPEPQWAPPPPPPVARFKPRPEGEWDGMLVNLASQPPCLDGAVCGMARACIEGVCTACGSDHDCNPGEVCVLDHCLMSDRVSCRSTKECSNGAKCTLSGYSADLRGNADLSSRCVSPRSGSGVEAADNAAQVAAPRPEPAPRAVTFDDEMARARALPLPE
jgi:hypothetical protein